MIDALYTWADRKGTWARAGLVFAGCLACVAGFALRQEIIRQGACEPPGDVLDARWRYTPADVKTYFDRIGKTGQSLYATTQLTLDLLFPLLYGSLFVCLVVRLCPPAFAQWWMWVPVAMVVADLGENLILAHLAAHHDGSESGLAAVAACFTAAKWGLFAATALGLVFGAGWALVARIF